MDINRITTVVQASIQTAPPENIGTTNSQANPAAAAKNVEQVNPIAELKPANVNADELKRSVNTINQYLKSFNNTIQFSIDKDSGQVIVKLVDTETQAVLKQTPTKEALAMAQALEKAQGLFIHTKA